MPCSSFESQLSAHVDGELGPVSSARIARHLAGCDRCAGMVEELRSIDALLLTPRELEPAPNFSFVVMAEVRSLPAPHAHRSRPLAILATYVVFAWCAIGAFLVLGGASARAMLATLGMIFGRLATVATTLATATERLFGRHTFDVTAAMGALLALDLVIAGVVFAAFVLLRARRTTALDGPESC